VIDEAETFPSSGGVHERSWVGRSRGLTETLKDAHGERGLLAVRDTTKQQTAYLFTWSLYRPEPTGQPFLGEPAPSEPTPE